MLCDSSSKRTGLPEALSETAAEDDCLELEIADGCESCRLTADTDVVCEPVTGCCSA